MENKKERDYIKEYELMKSKNKIYSVKVPKDIANIFDSKLKNNNTTFAEVARKAIEKFIKNN